MQYQDNIEKLNRLKKTDLGMKVPEGYFDTIREQIFEKIENQEKNKNKKYRFIKILKPALALVACFILVLLIKFASQKTIEIAGLEFKNTESNLVEEYLLSDTYTINSVVLEDLALIEPQLQLEYEMDENVLSSLSDMMTDVEIYADLINAR